VIFVRIRLLAPLGGHTTGDVLDHDHAAAEWLVSAGLAVHINDQDANPGETAPTSANTPTAPTASRTPTTRRTTKRRPG
jgi:hypothetical protein